MPMQRLPLRTGWIARAALLLFTTALAAQTAGNSKFLLPMAANAKEVTGYAWKQRITVVRRGRPEPPIIDQVRFDSTGQLQRTTISAPEQKTGRIRGRIAAGVREDVKGIMELAGRYNKPQQMIEAIRKAQASEGPAGTRLQSSGLIVPSDSMTMLLNPATHLASHIDISTTYEGGPMTIAQDYARIPGGPNVMRSMRVSVPAKDLGVNVDSYDFVQQSAQRR